MRETELAIVGAGPAGLCAAIEAAEAGVKVTLIDENSRPGGQLFKQIHKFFGSREHYAGMRGLDIGAMLLEETKKRGVDVMLDTIAWGIFEDNVLGLATKEKSIQLKPQKILLATGALERPLAFPGWTLPNVMGAGAMQTLINIHRVLPGKRVLMVGSGNVGLIVSYQLLQAGAEVVALIDALPRVGGYLVHAAKVRRNGIPIYTSTTVKEVTGDGKVEKAVTVELDDKWQQVPGTEKEYDVDSVCLAVGLSPLAELAWMAGCEFCFVPELGGFVPLHDESMETSVPGIYVAGDSAGVEEVNTAIEGGRLAGLSIAGALGKLTPERVQQRKDEMLCRLEGLRSGPLGEARCRGHATLAAEYAKACPLPGKPGAFAT